MKLNTTHIHYDIQQKEKHNAYAEESKAYNLLNGRNKAKFINIHPIFNTSNSTPNPTLTKRTKKIRF